MSYISTTDYWAARQIEANPLAYAAIAVLRSRVAADAPARRPGYDVYGQRIAPADAPSPPPENDTQRSRGSSSSKIDYRPHRRSRFTVKLLGGVQRAIDDELRAAAPYRVENGGYLYSLSNARASDWVEMCLATGAGPHSKHSSSSVELSRADVVESEFPDHLQSSDLVRGGCYHSHPNGTTEPSPTDRESWAASLSRTGLSHYVGLIACPDPDMGWMEPKLHAWIAYRDSARDRVVIERARIDLGYGY